MLSRMVHKRSVPPPPTELVFSFYGGVILMTIVDKKTISEITGNWLHQRYMSNVCLRDLTISEIIEACLLSQDSMTALISDTALETVF